MMRGIIGFICGHGSGITVFERVMRPLMWLIKLACKVTGLYSLILGIIWFISDEVDKQNGAIPVLSPMIHSMDKGWNVPIINKIIFPLELTFDTLALFFIFAVIIFIMNKIMSISEVIGSFGSIALLGLAGVVACVIAPWFRAEEIFGYPIQEVSLFCYKILGLGILARIVQVMLYWVCRIFIRDL